MRRVELVGARPIVSWRPSVSNGWPRLPTSSRADEAAHQPDLTKNGKRLGFLPADAIGPAVRALDWGDAAFFGVDRVNDLAPGR